MRSIFLKINLHTQHIHPSLAVIEVYNFESLSLSVKGAYNGKKTFLRQ